MIFMHLLISCKRCCTHVEVDEFLCQEVGDLEQEGEESGLRYIPADQRVTSSPFPSAGTASEAILKVLRFSILFFQEKIIFRIFF